jgi:SrtB family sortase
MLKDSRFWIAVVLLVIALGFTVFRKTRSYEISGTAEEIKLSQSAELQTTVSETAVMNETTESVITEILSETAEDAEYDATEPYISEKKVTEVKGKLNTLSADCDDLIGWIYVADSDIDYPVVQGTDNQYYLHHSPDGRKNDLGSIFLDSQCEKDFSGKHNILYGHNMQYGMFGDIRFFKEKDNFDKHRYGWLFTNDSIYRIDFFALAVVSALDEIYDMSEDDTDIFEHIKETSINYTETELSENDRFIYLSTCASEFEDARALFIGKIEPFTSE